MKSRRRLPLLEEPKRDAPEQDEEDPPRPASHWIGFGTVAIFAAWLPLAYLAGAVVKRAIAPYVGTASGEAEIAARVEALSADARVRLALLQMLPHAVAFAIAAFAGGFLVGRFGPGTGAREGAAAGAATAILATAIAATGGFGSIATVVVVVVVSVALATGFAAWGGRAGARARAVREQRQP